MKEKTDRLKKSIDEAARLDENSIADRIRSMGFKCLNCASCCKGDCGDNTVTVFPFEISRISGKTGLNKESIVVPTPSEDRDEAGNIHTFEWVLKKNGDCIFLNRGLCRIYECRPYICSTYPFYLSDGRLVVSECKGIGGKIDYKESLMMAVMLKERYIAEIRESVALFEKFRGFFPSGKGDICVHDSEGEHWICIKDIGKI